METKMVRTNGTSKTERTPDDMEILPPAKAKTKTSAITIPRPNMQTIQIMIEGTAPLSCHKFSGMAQQSIEDAQTKVGAKNKRGSKPPRKPQVEFEGAIHRSPEGWIAWPASAFRNAMISSCRLVGYQMTRAKLTVFIVADGYEKETGDPIVRLLAKDPEMHRSAVRLDSGVVSLAYRPLWREDWHIDLSIRYDGDQFTADDMVNLLWRAGMQVGIGEGRHDSRNSNGIGWGTFRVLNEEERLAVLKRKAALFKNKPRAVNG